MIPTEISTKNLKIAETKSLRELILSTGWHRTAWMTMSLTGGGGRIGSKIKLVDDPTIQVFSFLHKDESARVKRLSQATPDYAVCVVSIFVPD